MQPLGLQSASGWRVALLAKNLTDQSYATFIQNSSKHIDRYVPRDDRRCVDVNDRNFCEELVFRVRQV